MLSTLGPFHPGINTSTTTTSSKNILQVLTCEDYNVLDPWFPRVYEWRWMQHPLLHPKCQTEWNEWWRWWWQTRSWQGGWISGQKLAWEPPGGRGGLAESSLTWRSYTDLDEKAIMIKTLSGPKFCTNTVFKCFYCSRTSGEHYLLGNKWTSQ